MGQAVARGKPRATIAEEQATAYRLQLEGWTVDAIAAHLGVSHGTVVNRITAAARERVYPAVDAMRQVEGERLEAAYAALRPRIAKGDPAAVSAAVRVSERRSRLFGLDLERGAHEKAAEADEAATADVIASVLGDVIEALVDVAVDDPVWRGKVEAFGIEYAQWCLAGRPDGGRPIPPARPEPVVVEAEVMGDRWLRPEQEAALRDPASPFYGLQRLLSEIVDAEVVESEDVAASEADEAGGDRGEVGADLHDAGVDA